MDFGKYRAPGRVNLIGEHTDYNLGLVLPIAIDLACYATTSPADDGRLTVRSENLNAEAAWPVDRLGDLEPAKAWSDYVLGVAQQLIAAGYPLAAARLNVRSTVPTGSGLSSSAALEVSTALALLGGRTIDRIALVKLCQRAEREFVGMPCGIMDQFVSVFGEENAAVEIDCRTLAHQTAPLPGNVAILAVNSMVKHELGASAYRDRVRECAEAVDAIRRQRSGVESLRDVSSRDVEALAPGIPEIPLKRARHIASENERVEAFVEASRAGDLTAMGELFVESHRSLQRDYEVSCEELDFLVEAAVETGAVYGARMTGGGFGGCTVNLVKPDAVDQFEKRISAAYQERFGVTPAIYRCRPSAGAGAA